MIVLLASWMACWLAGWLAGWLDGWMAGWPAPVGRTLMGVPQTGDHVSLQSQHLLIETPCKVPTANLQTKILHFGGFDSSRILCP